MMGRVSRYCFTNPLVIGFIAAKKRTNYLFFMSFFFVCSNAFADETCDLDCAEEAKTYAYLSERVYSVENEQVGDVYNGWELAQEPVIEDKDDCPGIFVFNSVIAKIKGSGYGSLLPFCKYSGFKMALYKNSENEYVLAFAGTDDSDDIFIDAMQATGISHFPWSYDQYKHAKAHTVGIKSVYGDKLIAVTGHSLGGGLATYVSLHTGIPAYTFNPARISPPYILANYSRFTDNFSKISSYISYAGGENAYARDLVSSIWEPGAPGTNFIVDVPLSFLSDNWLVLSDFKELHSKQIIKKSLELLAGGSPLPPENVPKSTNPLATQAPITSSPGGEAMRQIVQGGTPGGTGTMKILWEESGNEEEMEISFNERGVYDEWYSPTVNKPVGSYVWYIEDHSTDELSNSVPYKILDDSDPNSLYGHEGNEIIDDTPSDCLPDFVAKRAWITKSENGNDKYVFEIGDDAWINVKVKNQGCQDSPQDIDVWYFLSSGEKEDGHHDWEKIGDDTIRQDELLIGQDKWEKEEFTVPNEPGTYNIVACADRIAQYDNGYGDVLEEHKSNDCSTEAVFTVLPKNRLPIGKIEAVSCSQISGWAIDPDMTPVDLMEIGNPVFINIYLEQSSGEKELIDQIYADKTTGTSTDGVVANKKAFHYIIPEEFRDGLTRNLSVFAVDDFDGEEEELCLSGGEICNVNLTCSQSDFDSIVYENKWNSDDGNWQSDFISNISELGVEGEENYFSIKEKSENPLNFLMALTGYDLTDFGMSPPVKISFEVKKFSGKLSHLHLRFRYLDSSHNGWRYPIKFDQSIDDWKVIEIGFDPRWSDQEAISNGWIREDLGAPFFETMNNFYQLIFNLYGSDDSDIFGLDDFRIKRLIKDVNDSDKDGLSNEQEMLIGSNPYDPDSDEDGLDDQIEHQINTDPKKWDSDTDGLSDGREISLGTNPLISDSDGDGYNDGFDNCPLLATYNLTDTDTDGVGDACDNDDDNDSIVDDLDNCPTTANSDQINFDGDGFGDICDNDDDNDGAPDNNEATNGTNPLDANDWPQPFTDVTNTNPDYTASLKLFDSGVTTGCATGRFCSDQVITRNTAAIWLLRAKDGAGYTPPAASGTIYSDVSVETFAADYIEEIGFNRGISEGCNSNATLFCPTSPITRNSAARLLIRTQGLWEPPSGSDDLFEDVAANDFASGAINKMVVLGYLEGCSATHFCPNQLVTRSEFAQILMDNFNLTAQ